MSRMFTAATLLVAAMTAVPASAGAAVCAWSVGVLPVPNGYTRVWGFVINDEQVGGHAGAVPLVWTRTC